MDLRSQRCRALGASPVDEDLEHAGNEVIPEQLLHGGHHFDDIGTAGRRTRQRRYERIANGAPLPREALHSYVASIGVTRPTVHPTTREWSLVQWLQVLILCGEDVGSNPAGKLFTPQKLSIHIPNPSLPPSLRRRRGQVPSEILQKFP